MSLTFNQISSHQLSNETSRKSYNAKELKLLLPYYESDKWTNKLKNKILKLSNKYETFYDRYLLSQNNMMNSFKAKNMKKSFNNNRYALNNTLQNYLQINQFNNSNELEKIYMNKTNLHPFFLNKQKLNTQKANMNKFYSNINLDNDKIKFHTNRRIKFFKINA